MTNLEMAESEAATEEDTADRSPCSLCGRKFLTDRLEKHLQICQKLKEKKRKTFDAAKQRAENLDKINLVPTEININSSVTIEPPKVPAKKKPTGAAGKPKAASPNAKESTADSDGKTTTSSKKSNWRAQHEEFIRNIRAARGEELTLEEVAAQEEAASSRSKSLPPGMVECPSCGRRFSERAADRHIAWCAEKAANKQMEDRNSHKDQEALERMKARTKYKPPSLTNAPATGGSSGAAAASRSNSKGRSNLKANSTNSQPRVASTSSRKSTDTSRTSSSTSNINHKYTRNISKSTESLASNKTRTRQVAAPVKRSMASNGGGTASRASTRTDVSDSNRHSGGGVHRDSQRTVVVRRVNNGHSHVTSKINTGLTTQGNGARSPTKSSAPVMKFKEKFPNHQRTNAAPFDTEILRRNSTAEYDDSPKTVPGVRTGGISPVKSNNNSGASLSRSEVNLHKIGGDIKKRIDMYISGLYDNEVLSHYADNFTRAIDEHFHGKTQPTEEEIEAFKRETMASMALEGQTRRAHSVNSDLSGADARGSTSDSADSGLGVYGTNAHENGACKPVNVTYPTEILSPPMSELERRSRLMLRNGSLNDIHHLMGQDAIVMTAAVDDHSDETVALSNYYATEVDLPVAEMTPRFCHSCGTKYPNTLAKFCYECGNRRYATAVEH